MSEDYDLPTDEVIDRLERIERRLDLMGQRIAYLEGYVMGGRKDTELPRSLSLDSAWEKNQRSQRRFMRLCWTLVATGTLLKLM